MKYIKVKKHSERLIVKVKVFYKNAKAPGHLWVSMRYSGHTGFAPYMLNYKLDVMLRPPMKCFH